MPTERLEYRFEKSGLSQLRRDMQQLSQDTEDVGDSAQETAADLEEMGEADVTNGDIEDAQDAVSDLGTEAEESASQLEESFDGAAAEVKSELESIAGQLTSIDDQDIAINAQGEGGGVVTAALGVAGVGQLSQIRSQMASMPREFSFEAQGLEELVRKLEEAKQGAEELEKETEDVEQETEQAGEAADDLGDTSGPESLYDALNRVGDEADDADESIEDVGNEASKLGNVGGGMDQGLPDELEQGGGGIGAGGGFLAGRLGGMFSSSSMAAGAASAAAYASAIAGVGAAFAAATKEMADFAAQQAVVGQQLKVAESQSGVAAQEVQKLFLVSRRLDSTVDLDSIRDAFKELALRTEEAREGTGEAREAFDRLGISMDELEGKGTAEIFELVRKRASELTAQQRALTLEQVAGGEAGERLARIFGLQADEYDRLISSVQGEVLSSEQIKELDTMRQRYTAIQQRLERLQQDLALAFGPEAIDLLGRFTSGLEDVVGLLKDAASAYDDVDPVREQNRAPFSGGGELTTAPDATMGSAESVQFTGGSTRENSDSRDVPEPVQAMREALAQMETQVAVARQKFARGLIDVDTMQQQVLRARESAVTELLKLEEQAPDLIPDAKVDEAVANVRQLKRRMKTIALPNVTEAPSAEEIAMQDSSSMELASPGGLSSLRRAAGSANSVEDINTLIEATRDQFDTLNNDEAQGFVAMLQKAKAEMQEAQSEAELIGDAMSRSIARSADRLFDLIGQGVSDAIFGGGGGPGRAQSELGLLNAKKEMRSLKRQLRQGEISYREFSLRTRTQQQKIQKQQEQLNEAMQGGFANAADTMLSTFKRIAKQLIAEITAVVAKMAVLKAITTAFSISSGGFAGSIISNLGGGSFLDSAATGGSVRKSGIAKIHKGEEIVPSKTVSTLESLLQPSTPSVQPAAMGGSNMAITVNVTGETRTDGRDLKTSYDTTTRVERRKGRR